MIVLSVGMPRAGSGWYYNLTHDLLVAAGFQDARKIRGKYRLGRILTEVNCNIGTLAIHRLVPVLTPSILGNTFAIKAHAEPRPLARVLIRLGGIRPTYIYRDPRGALLSAFEYGQHGLGRGRANAFSHLTTIESALDFIQGYIPIWEAWTQCKWALLVRYEDLVDNYDVEVNRLLGFLGLAGRNEDLSPVVGRYRPGGEIARGQGLHFRTGVRSRFRTALTPEQLEACTQALAPALERMGYPL